MPLDAPSPLACPQVLYGMVREAAQLRPGNQDVVFDLYCGEWCLTCTAVSGV